jgi:eukaryotic-like serine/threonine-protein kinase
LKHCTTCQHLFPDQAQVCPTDNTPLRVARELEPGMIVRNKYVILEWIGAGGMATVYRAKHRLLNEMRAVKVVSAKFANDEDFLKRFRHEAAVARRLRHENAVWVEDLDEIEDGRPFIAMELLQGDDLRKVIKEQGPLAVDRSLKLGAQVASALGAAHKLGIIHRDIKPDNILITRDDSGNEVPKVLDFGIAKARESALQGSYTATRTGVIIGTPEYMSPEQAEGQLGDKLDGRSDIYSLGIVLYEMLTGQLPFKSDTPLGMCLHHMQTIPRPPHAVRPDLHIPESVSAILMKALEKKREQRFQSAQEMQAALRGPAAWAAKNASLAPTRIASPSAPANDYERTVALDVGPKAAVAARQQPAAPQRVSSPVAAVSQPPKQSPIPQPVPVKDESMSRRILLVAVVVIICALAGYFLLKATQRRNAALRAHDSVLRDLIVEKFQSSPVLKDRSVTVAVNSDVATLTGNVPLPGDKDAAANLAKSVAGVSDVINNIEVVGVQIPLPKPPETTSPPATSETEKQKPPDTTSAAQPQPRRQNNSANLARANELVRQGNAEIEDGKYAAAISNFKRALQLDPNNSAALNGINRANQAEKAERKVLDRTQ